MNTTHDLLMISPVRAAMAGLIEAVMLLTAEDLTAEQFHNRIAAGSAAIAAATELDQAPKQADGVEDRSWWRTMESAPKDRKILTIDAEGRMEVAKWYSPHFSPRFADWYEINEEYITEPVRWMELPEPPPETGEPK